MYNRLQNAVFDGVVTTALSELMDEELNAAPEQTVLNSAYPIPKQSVQKAKRKMKENHYHAPLVLVYTRRAAVVVLALISVTFAALSTSEPVQAAIAETVVTWYEETMRIDFSKLDHQYVDKPKSVEELKIGYIPDGFTLSETIEWDGFREYIYYNDNKEEEYLFIDIQNSQEGEVIQDTEQHEYEEIQIHGMVGYMLYNEAERQGSITYGNAVYAVLISGYVDKTELLKIAENIV